MYGIYIIYHILYIYIVDIEHISGGSAAIAFSTRAETSGAAEDAEPAPPDATDELAPAPPSGLGPGMMTSTASCCLRFSSMQVQQRAKETKHQDLSIVQRKGDDRTKLI